MLFWGQGWVSGGGPHLPVRAPSCRMPGPGAARVGASPPCQVAVSPPSRCSPPPRAHQGELVGDLAVRWDFGTKAVCGEELVAVVVLDDLPHRLQRQGVGAQLVGARVVQRGGLRWHPCGTAPIGTCPTAGPAAGTPAAPATLTVGGREVDGNGEIQLRPWGESEGGCRPHGTGMPSSSPTAWRVLPPWGSIT